MSLSDDWATDLANTRITRRQALWLLGAGVLGASALGTAGGSHAAEYTLIKPDPMVPAQRPAAMRRTMNLQRQLLFKAYNNAQRYQRWQTLVILKGDEGGVEFLCMSAGGALVPFLTGHYKLLIDGQFIAAVEVTNGASRAEFRFGLESIDEGWHVFDIVGHAQETCAFMPMYVMKSEVAEVQEWMPVFSGSHSHKSSPSEHVLFWVPTKFEPTIVHAPKRPEYQHFDTAIARSELYRETLIVARGGDIHRPCMSKEGIMTTTNRQWYTYSDFVGAKPKGALLDGPRGMGCLAGPTHVEIGIGTTTSDPTSAPRNNVYVLDSWRVCRVSETGTITTLVGHRHRNMAAYWEDPQESLELVGDWSAIPEERQGFHETWGMCWDSESLLVDDEADPIPADDDRQPHIRAPVMFVADSQNDRIVRVEFNATAHDVPPRVTEFVTDVADAWDVVEWRNSIIVSERGSHRICQYSIRTGKLERVILQGAPLARVLKHTRLNQRLASLKTIRAQPVVGPEGLYVMDDWLYFASVAMAQVKRVHLETGEVEHVVNYGSRMDKYLKIAVSDGTFGPRHSLFITAWTVNKFGAPQAYLPNGTQWAIVGSGRNISRGPGGFWDSSGYNGAVAVRNGRLVYGGSSEGLFVVSRRLPVDETCKVSLYRAGARRWNDEGFDYEYGPRGFGYYGLRLPWGFSEETDYYLEWNGHGRGDN